MGNTLKDLLDAPLDRPLDLGGFRARRAQSDEERGHAFALRSKVFADEGFIDPSDYPGGRFVDPLDEVAAHFTVHAASGELAATTRFVLPSPKGYATEQLFDFVRPRIDRKRLGEFGRLAIERAHRGGQRIPMLLLLALVYRCMRQHEIEWVYAFLPPKLVSSYAALGCVSEPLALLPVRLETLARRRSMQGYFERQDVGPVLFRLTDMLEAVRSR